MFMNYDKLLKDLKELHKEMLEQGNTVEADYILNRAIPTVEKRKNSLLYRLWFCLQVNDTTIRALLIFCMCISLIYIKYFWK